MGNVKGCTTKLPKLRFLSYQAKYAMSLPDKRFTYNTIYYLINRKTKHN